MNVRHCCFLMVCCLVLTFSGSAQIQKIYVKPKEAGIEKQSKFVDSIRFIPLEIKKEMEIPSFSSVEFSRNYMMFSNPEDMVIMLYSKTGTFVSKISYKKIGDSFESFYDEVNDQIVFFGDNNNYLLTPKDRLKIMLNRNDPRNLKYFRKYVVDLNDSSFTLRKVAPGEKDLARAIHLHDNVWYRGDITTSPLFKDSLGYEFRLFRNDRLIKGYFPYDQISEPRFLYTDEEINITKTADPVVNVLTRPFCDTVYKLTGDSLFPFCRLVLPLENSLPASFFTKPFKNKADRENYNRNNGWIFHQVYNFYETNRFISFDIEYLTRLESYIYQKETKTVLNIKNIKPDSSQYNLKLLSDNNAELHEGRYYRLVHAADLLSFFAENKNIPIPDDLKDFLAGKPDAETPVVIEYKLKN